MVGDPRRKLPHHHRDSDRCISAPSVRVGCGEIGPVGGARAEFEVVGRFGSVGVDHAVYDVAFCRLGKWGGEDSRRFWLGRELLVFAHAGAFGVFGDDPVVIGRVWFQFVQPDFLNDGDGGFSFADIHVRFGEVSAVTGRGSEFEVVARFQAVWIDLPLQSVSGRSFNRFDRFGDGCGGFNFWGREFLVFAGEEPAEFSATSRKW